MRSEFGVSGTDDKRWAFWDCGSSVEAERLYINTYT